MANNKIQNTRDNSPSNQSSLDKLISVSLHRYIFCKPEKIPYIKNGKRYTGLYCGGSRINPAKDWVITTKTYSEVFHELTNAGKAIAPILKDDYKEDKNFISHDMALVDIDHGMTIFDLFNSDYYNTYGSGFYASPSYKDDDHRFRIIFVFENTITDPADMTAIYAALINKFGGDTSCIDPTRLFYGNTTEIKEIRKNFLPVDEINNLIATGKAFLEEAAKRKKEISAAKTVQQQKNTASSEDIISEAERAIVVKALQTISLKDQYKDYCSLAWGMRTSGFTYNDFATATHEDSSTAADVFSRYRYSNVTMGTVMHILKKYMTNDAYEKMWLDIIKTRNIEQDTAKIAHHNKSIAVRNALAEYVRGMVANV